MFLILPAFFVAFGLLLVKRVAKKEEIQLVNTSFLPRPTEVEIRSQWPYTPVGPGVPKATLHISEAFVTTPSGSSEAIDILEYIADSRENSLRFTVRPLGTIQITPSSTQLFRSFLKLTGDETLNVNWSTNTNGDIQTFDKRLTNTELSIKIESLVGPVTITPTQDVIALARMWSKET